MSSTGEQTNKGRRRRRNTTTTKERKREARGATPPHPPIGREGCGGCLLEDWPECRQTMRMH